MPTKLVIDPIHEDSVVWLVDGEVGGRIGDLPSGDLAIEMMKVHLKEAIKSGDQDQSEFWAVELAAATWLQTNDDNDDIFTNKGLRFRNKKLLNKFLAAMKANWQMAKLNKPLPDWVRTALSEGWKPPAGWKP